MAFELKSQEEMQQHPIDTCRIKGCWGEAEVLWSDKEGPIIDVCVEHRKRLSEEASNV
jgi:hypothetical protein